MQPLPLKYVQQQELLLLLGGKGAFDYHSIQTMPIYERMFFVRELEELAQREEEERAKAEAMARHR